MTRLSGRLATAWLSLVGFTAVFGSFLGLPDPDRAEPLYALQPVLTKGHILGTDALGRDILARIVAGSRVSVFIGVVAVSAGLVVGGLIGTFVGYRRGRIERAAIVVTNVLLSFPGLILLLGVVGMVGSSLKTITTVIAVLSIPVYVRFARAGALQLSEEGFVHAAEMIGTKQRTIVARELIPNVLPTLMTFGLLALGGVIVTEGVLAFLGLSIPPPTATWGSMIAEGRGVLDKALHVAIVPSTVMFLTVLSINLVGDGVRRRFDVGESSL